MDPITISAAISTATAAFGGIKRAFAAGRDLESMSQDLSRWMGAVSDVDNAQKSAANASPLIKLFKGKEIQASAIEAFTAKKKLEAQRQELKTFLNMTYGPQSWAEILKLEAEIRLRRKEEIYNQQEFVRKVWEYIGWTFLFFTVVGFVIVIAWLYKESKG